MADVVFVACPIANVDGSVAKNLYNLVRKVVAEIERRIKRDLEQTYLVFPLDIRLDNEQPVVQVELNVLLEEVSPLFVTTT